MNLTISVKISWNNLMEFKIGMNYFIHVIISQLKDDIINMVDLLRLIGWTTREFVAGKYLYRISSNKHRVSNKRRAFGYPHWNKRLPLINATSLTSAAPLNVALINAFGPTIQIIKQWKYCWYLDFLIIFGLLIVEIYVSLLFWKKKWEGFDI